MKQTAGVCLQNIYDYSPFGVSLDGRTIEGDFYRYGFNGMEKDDAVKGKGNSYSTEFRQFDPRFGRCLSVDLFNKNPVLNVILNGISVDETLSNKDEKIVPNGKDKNE